MLEKNSLRVRGNSWFRGFYPASMVFTTLMTPNSDMWDCDDDPDLFQKGMFAARSQHPGGVQVTLGDGSVRFVSETIDFDVWKFSGGIRDKQVVQLP